LVALADAPKATALVPLAVVDAPRAIELAPVADARALPGFPALDVFTPPIAMLFVPPFVRP